MKILITGVAGFIGYHLAKSLINTDYDIVGIDNLNSYYDLDLKKARLSNLKKIKLYFCEVDICNQIILNILFLLHLLRFMVKMKIPVLKKRK